MSLSSCVCARLFCAGRAGQLAMTHNAQKFTVRYLSPAMQHSPILAGRLYPVRRWRRNFNIPNTARYKPAQRAPFGKLRN